MRLIKALPGIGLLCVIGLLAFALAYPFWMINTLILSVLLGILVGNTLGVPEWAEKGVGTHKLWLESGIIIMGTTIAINQVISTGPTLLGLVLLTVIFGILLVELISRVTFNFDNETSSLIASGMSICGVSAVVAVAGSIKADESRIAYVVAVVLLMDTITLFIYPFIGSILSLPDRVFGIWTGITMLSTGPASAAGFAYSVESGEWATITKVVRNALIGFVAVAYSIAYAQDGQSSEISEYANSIWRSFPKFIIGFIIAVAVSGLGMFSESQISIFDDIYTLFFTIAFVGLGFEIQLKQLRNVGVRPLLPLILSFLVVSMLSLIAVTYLFG